MNYNKINWKRILRNWGVLIGVLMVASLADLLLFRFFEDSTPFAVPVFILAVAIVARYTEGYLYGVIAALISVILVNYLFTYPYFAFNLTLAGYPLTFSVMLLVSLLISTLTSRIKKQEQLRYEADREKMRANLLRSVSHDIRTPLASILGASSALLENRELPEEDRRELLGEINKDAQWLTRLTENILSVTKFSGGEVSLHKNEEVVEEIVGSAIRKFRKNAETIPILVSKPEEILLCPMDATLIEQVLINLFDNVVSHAEKATQIWVEITQEGSRAAVNVIDNGVGIPENLLPRVFDGYVHIESPSQPDGRRNMGIGLSVCRSIIRAHGGEMNAGNNVFGGATFGFWLPIEEENKHAAQR